MATIAKFYFHDATTTNTGTMPGSSDAFITDGSSGDTTGDATGARTARAADGTIGAAETSSLITATANTNPQLWGHRRFVSPPLAAATISGGTWNIEYATVESNTNHVGFIHFVGYLWRPGTGARVGTAFIAQTFTITSTTKAAVFQSLTWTGTATTQNGDIIVFEFSDVFTQSMSTAYTSTFYYDGTTESTGGTTNKASVFIPPSALTLATSGNTYTKAGFGKESA